MLSRLSSRFLLCRGVSSTVRRVIERRTGKEYAAKIVDVSAERVSEAEAEDVRQATRREVAVLRRVAGHTNISKSFEPVGEILTKLIPSGH